MKKLSLLLLILSLPFFSFSQVRIFNDFPISTNPNGFTKGSRKGLVTLPNLNGVQKNLTDFMSENYKEHETTKEIYARMIANSIEVYRANETYSNKEIDSIANKMTKRFDSIISSTKSDLSQLIIQSLKGYNLTEGAKSDILESLNESMKELITKEVEHRLSWEIEILKTQMIEELSTNEEFLKDLKTKIGYK